ncbi:uracil-DNA glycosylase family protein [Methanosarcina sp. Mfa9]|uniref:uracil-DNA glycosylase family protein n=1 Tax=Methanosarcina sp. Mfa9 TaxID=3439063 RepID=UPI003F868669
MEAGISESGLEGKNEKMTETINNIRNCELGCYRDRYLFPLKTTGNRTISINELVNGKPLIDDWRGQKVLFISQAPSKQAWADHELNSLKNSFLSDFLLPKVYPEENLETAIEKWKNSVFWIHTANCYPFVFSKERKRDRSPDMKCANRYFGQIIDVMKPELIILMGLSSTKYFSHCFKLLLQHKKTGYPTLNEIIDLQYNNLGKSIFISSKSDKKAIYDTVIIPHAADWNKLSEKEKFAYELLFKKLN